MGLFEKKKKDAERCPICGKEISFFSGLVIADGTICDDCEKMVRGQFNIEEYYGRENWKISTSEETTSRDDTGVYPNATGLTEVAMGVTEDICTFKVPLNYVLAGGYYDENNEEHTIQGLNSATTTVEEALAAGSFSTGNHMMIWANVTEQDLYKEKEIETSFGETLSWEYLCYVREHPVVWNIPTKILYGDKDNLTSYETMSDFASKMGISLTVMNNGEHWFHTDEQMNFLDDWICESNR